MKLLYIANQRLPTEKAYGVQIAKMCEAFASERLDVKLAYPFRDNHIEDDLISYYSVKSSFKVKRIWAPDFYFPGRLDKIAVNIKEVISALLLCFYALTCEVDIIYSRDEWPLYFLSFFKKNLFFEAHKFSDARKLFYKRFKKVGIKTIVISGGLKDDFLKFGFTSDSLLLAPDGVDLEEFNIDISKKEARVRMDLPLDRKIVMYTGHLFEWKGADILLQAAKTYNLQPTTYNPLFVFVGGMPADIENFRKKAEKLMLNNVLILGHKPHKEIPFFLKAADILVLPNSAKEEISRSYTSPLKLFEYMAVNRPIVASNLPSIQEVLDHDNSILVKSDSPEDLVNGIEIILNKPDASSVIAQKALEDVKNYTWQKRAESILKFIG